MNAPCIACGRSPTDRAHIKSKGSGGTWAEDNIIALCRRHHSEQHQLGWVEFLGRHPAAELTLALTGWEVRDVLGTRKLVRVGP